MILKFYRKTILIQNLFLISSKNFLEKEWNANKN